MQRKSPAKLALFLTIAVSSVYATNGAFDYGFSEITRGMGGSGAALPQDTVITAINPAGLAFVKHIADVGAVMYFPDMDYRASDVSPNAPGQIILSPGHHISNVSFFFLPDFGLKMPVSKVDSIGFAFFSLGGFGSSYPGWGTTLTTSGPPASVPPTQNPGPFGGRYLASDLKQAEGSLTFAHNFGFDSSFGLSLLMGVQTLNLQGADLLKPFSNDPYNMTNRSMDSSFGVGVRGGLLLGFIPHVKLAASYQPKVLMSKFHLYKGLFPNNGEFDYPANGVLGVDFELPKKIDVTFDVQRIWFENIAAYGNNDSALLPGGACSLPGEAPNPFCFGGYQGVGFGWRNVTAYKTGVQWQATPRLALRAGFSHANSVLRPNQAAENVVAPGGAIQNIVTLGFSQRVGKTGQLNAMLAVVPPQHFDGINAFSTTANQTVSIRATGFGIGTSYSWLFA